MSNASNDLKKLCYGKGVSLFHKQTLKPKNTSLLKRVCEKRKITSKVGVNRNTLNYGVPPLPERAIYIRSKMTVPCQCKPTKPTVKQALEMARDPYFNGFNHSPRYNSSPKPRNAKTWPLNHPVYKMNPSFKPPKYVRFMAKDIKRVNTSVRKRYISPRPSSPVPTKVAPRTPRWANMVNSPSPVKKNTPPRRVVKRVVKQPTYLSRRPAWMTKGKKTEKSKPQSKKITKSTKTMDNKGKQKLKNKRVNALLLNVNKLTHKQKSTKLVNGPNNKVEQSLHEKLTQWANMKNDLKNAVRKSKSNTTIKKPSRKITLRT